MKPANQYLQKFFSISGRRRNYLSALATGLLFLFGFPQPSQAAVGNFDTYNIQVPDDNAIAGSGLRDKVTVQILGPGGIPLLGQDVTFLFGGLSFPAQSDGAGTYFFLAASSIVQSPTVTIYLGLVPIGTVTINFIAGPPATNPPPGSPNPSYFIVTHDNAIADGSDKDLVEIHLANPYGVDEPVGTLVTLTVTSSTKVPTDALLNGTTTTTITVPLGPGGKITIPITDLTVGSVTLQATYPGDPIPVGGPGFTQTIHFVAGPPDPSKSYIRVTQDPAPADGVTQDIVTAYLNDAQGRPTTGTVNFTILSGTATFVTTVTGTGTVAAQYVSNAVNSVQIQAALADGTFLLDQTIPGNNNYATIHFVTGLPDPSKSYILVTQDPAAADNATKDIVTAFLFDAQGRPTTGTITFSIQTGTATFVTTVTGTGTVAAEYISGTIGAVNIQAKYNGIFLTDQANPGNNFATIHFVIGPPDPSKSYIVVTPDGALADGVAQDVVTAYLFDAQGRAIIDGTNVTFSIVGTATIVNAADATQPVTAGSVAAQYVSNAVGAVKVQASFVLNGVTYYLNDQSNPTNNYATMHFVAGSPVPGDPGGGGTGGNPPGGGGNPPTGGGGPGGGNNGSNLKFTVLFVRQDFRFADGQQHDSVIAYVTDAYQHPLKNVSIQFSIQNTPTSGTATATAQFVGSPANVLTDDSGMARIAITSTKPGTVFVNAVLIVDGVLIDGSYQIVTFLNKPDVNNPLTNLSVVIYTALADGTQVTQVKAHIVDLDGNVMPGQDVTFSLDSGKATIVTPQPVTTDANGDAYITLTSTTPGYALVTAVVNGESIKFGSPARVRFAAINIYVPRVFTPNGDGSNDQLKPILVGIAEFHYFSVYNRWGNLIFTTQDANRGWDGTFKGVPQPVETYLWIGEGIDITGKKIVQKGMVSLVR